MNAACNFDDGDCGDHHEDLSVAPHTIDHLAGTEVWSTAGHHATTMGQCWANSTENEHMCEGHGFTEVTCPTTGCHWQ
jgi:hypothetical protein